MWIMTYIQTALFMNTSTYKFSTILVLGKYNLIMNVKHSKVAAWMLKELKVLFNKEAYRTVSHKPFELLHFHQAVIYNWILSQKTL